ncbi:MAG: NADH-quinone oxidoreductase subunit C [Acidobacteria bacterium]|nr:NADH-quinone oxidoreductase subunit C [Acidobacteriota bacterium]
MTLSESIVAGLTSRFPTQIFDVRERIPRKYSIRFDMDIVPDAVRYLKEQGARFIVSAGVDARQSGNGFEVTHIFSHDEEKAFFSVNTRLDGIRPKIKSITPIIPGANWAELEFRDLLGIELIGHPKPKRLILSEDWPDDLFPLRRDVPYNIKPQKKPDAPAEMKKPEKGQTVVPIGPFYPVLEEPAFLKLFVQGEEIVDCDYRGFFSHRGIEKLGDSKLTYNEIPFVAERICGI